MAFDISNLAYSGTDGSFTYTTTSDNKATTKGANYWQVLVGLVKVGTAIKVVATDGSYAGSFKYVSPSQPVPEVLLET